jgi:proteasome activator subunit 3 (PA28 gamma)
VDASSPSSPFHLDHAKTSTDPRIYPAPNVDGEPDTKKRRMETDGTASVGNDTAYARYLASVHANQHLTKVHAIVKKECEELAQNCVSPMST